MRKVYGRSILQCCTIECRLKVAMPTFLFDGTKYVISQKDDSQIGCYLEWLFPLSEICQETGLFMV